MKTANDVDARSHDGLVGLWCIWYTMVHGVICHSYFIDGYIFLNSRISDLKGRPRSCIPVTNFSKYARTASVSRGSQRVNFRFLRREVERAVDSVPSSLRLLFVPSK